MKANGTFSKPKKAQTAPEYEHCMCYLSCVGEGVDGVRQLVLVERARNLLLSARTLHLATNIPSPGPGM